MHLSWLQWQIQLQLCLTGAWPMPLDLELTGQQTAVAQMVVLAFTAARIHGRANGLQAHEIIEACILQQGGAI